MTQDTFRVSPLILGVGNLHMGDEGVGVHAVRHLEEQGLPAGIRLLDGGTGGFHLLSLFQEHSPIILIDATMDGTAAGTVTVTQPGFASDFPRTLSAHDIGLRDLLESASLIGPLPRMYLITISIDAIQSEGLSLLGIRLTDLGKPVPRLRHFSPRPHSLCRMFQHPPPSSTDILFGLQGLFASPCIRQLIHRAGHNSCLPVMLQRISCTSQRRLVA